MRIDPTLPRLRQPRCRDPRERTVSFSPTPASVVTLSSAGAAVPADTAHATMTSRLERIRMASIAVTIRFDLDALPSRIVERRRCAQGEASDEDQPSTALRCWARSSARVRRRTPRDRVARVTRSCSSSRRTSRTSRIACRGRAAAPASITPQLRMLSRPSRRSAGDRHLASAANEQCVRCSRRTRWLRRRGRRSRLPTSDSWRRTEPCRTSLSFSELGSSAMSAQSSGSGSCDQHVANINTAGLLPRRSISRAILARRPGGFRSGATTRYASDLLSTRIRTSSGRWPVPARSDGCLTSKAR